MRELIIFVRHPRKPDTNIGGLLFIANVAEYEVTEDYPLLVTGNKLPDVGTVLIATIYSLIGAEVNLTQLKLLSGEAVLVKFKSEK